MNSKNFLNFTYNLSLLGIVFLVFLFGRYSKGIEAEFKFPYEIRRDEANTAELQELIDFAEGKSEKIEIEEIRTELQNSSLDKNEELGYLFAASKKGKKYYPKGSKSLNRIKQENLIYFKTEEEAIKAGYYK